MILEEVLAGVALRSAWTPEVARAEVAGLAYDSRRVEKNFLFFAFRGSRMDGAGFARDAMDRGALAVVSELPRPSDFGGIWIEVEHGRRALATAARNFYGRPDERIHFTGVTGTNGKTTTSYLIDAILREAGFVTGLIGTIEYRLAGERRNAPNTTPESLDTMQFAAELAERGGSHQVSEISSHALAL
jgi:UDP-N-acetylmuramoyl-L-alanyl-D-glutamate--2,6-diaminopimelate ligase